MILDDRVLERIFRTEQKQPGSIHRALLVTQGHLTGNLPHLADAPSEIMMRGPVANSLKQRINEISRIDTGVLPMVEGRLLNGSESLRGAVLAARFRFVEHSKNANSLLLTRNQLRSTHANFMNLLTGDVATDQQIRDKITHVENDLGNIDREEGHLIDEMQREVKALRQRLDGIIHLLGGYVRLGISQQASKAFAQLKNLEQIQGMSIQDLAVWWKQLTDVERSLHDAKYGHVLRNLDGLPIDYRVEANRIFLEKEAETNPKLSQKLHDEGLLDKNGKLTSRVVLFDTTDGESFGESITVHGNCTNYDNVNLHYEGTRAGPGYSGTKLREKYDEWKFGPGQICTTTFVMRNTKNAEWGPIIKTRDTPFITAPVVSFEKFPSTKYGVDYNADKAVKFANGIQANAGATGIHVTGHSHGALTAAEVACRLKATAHLQDPAPSAFEHFQGNCVSHIYVYRDLDSSDADAKILSGNPLEFFKGVAEKASGLPILETTVIGKIVSSAFDDNKVSKILASESIPEQKKFESENPGVIVKTINSGDYGVAGGNKDSIYEKNEGSSHSAFNARSWSTTHRYEIAIHNAQNQLS